MQLFIEFFGFRHRNAVADCGCTCQSKFATEDGRLVPFDELVGAAW